MVFDAQGNELREGDTVYIPATIVKTIEGSQAVHVRTSEPATKPPMLTTIALRAENCVKQGG